MATMQVAQISAPGKDFELVERPIPTPGAGEVRVKVEACGICHSDNFTRAGTWPGIKYPRVPGHEIAGVIDDVGAGCGPWKTGQRVGVGWHGGHCTFCDSCRRGDFITCREARIPGISYDGGYAQFMIAPAHALAAIPDGISSVEAGPLLCAGITTFNALRNSGARPGDLVAVHGIGGLGHLGVQFARQSGYRVVALGRGADKQKLASDLGAHHYIDTSAQNPVSELTAMGGASVILATAPDAKAMGALVDALTPRGKLLIVAAPGGTMEVNPIHLLSGKSISGWPSGTSKDSEDTLRFAVTAGVRPMNEVFPLSRVNEAFDRMMTGKVRFRAVLRMSN